MIKKLILVGAVVAALLLLFPVVVSAAQGSTALEGLKVSLQAVVQLYIEFLKAVP